MALLLASSSRSASACMASGKRMGKESVCVLATSLLLCRKRLLCAGYERLLFARAHAIQATSKGCNRRYQIFGQFLFRRLLLIRVQHRQSDAISRKQGLQVRESKAREPVGARDADFGHLLFLSQRKVL